jgi:hypothetical protein
VANMKVANGAFMEHVRRARCVHAVPVQSEFGCTSFPVIRIPMPTPAWHYIVPFTESLKGSFVVDGFPRKRNSFLQSVKMCCAKTLRTMFTSTSFNGAFRHVQLGIRLIYDDLNSPPMEMQP